MALIPRSGSLTPTSTQELEPHKEYPNNTKFIDGNRYHYPNDGTLTNDKLVKDTLLNQTAWNVDRWSSGISEMAAYSDGAPIFVTYYNQDIQEGKFRNSPADISLGVENTVHKNLIKIIGLELRLTGALDYQHDKEENIFLAPGQLYTPIGFKPIVGDIFFMLLNDGKWGIMGLRDIERLSISQATFHKCDFELIHYLSPQLQEYFDKCVVDTRYYDRQKYYGSNMTLLNSNSYQQMNVNKQVKQNIITQYGKLFFSDEMNSFIHPDKFYDPYVVEFWHSMVTVEEYNKRPQQLIPELKDYNSTIFSCLSDDDSSANPIDYVKNYHIERSYYSYWRAGFTNLIDHDFVVIGEPPDPKHRDAYFFKYNENKLYIFSDAFYTGNTADMSFPEQVVYETLCGVIDIDRINTFAQNYRSWDTKFSFYWMPITIWLLTKAYFYITD